VKSVLCVMCYDEERGVLPTDFHGLAPALLSFRCSIQARFFDGRGGTRFPLIENGLGGMEEGELPTDFTDFHGLAPALPGFCRSIQARFFDGRGDGRL